MTTEPINIIPFYLDWKFWSFLTAFLALILSQLPPIRNWFQKTKLDVEAYNKINLTHKVGNPNASVHLMINNTGNRDVKIKSIDLKITRENGLSFQLPANSYFQLPSDKEEVLLTTFKLKPQQEWSHTVKFFNYFTREEEKEYRKLELSLKQDIFEKTDKIKLSSGMNSDVPAQTAEEKNVSPLIAFLEKKFCWFAGEYKLLISINTYPEPASFRKEYRFTLFESDHEELSSYQKDFKYGAGIYYHHDNHRGVTVTLKEA